MANMDEMYKFGKFCPICRLPISPIGMITSCPAHGEMLFLWAAFNREGDISCTGCGKTIRKRFTFCPYCGKRTDEK